MCNSEPVLFFARRVTLIYPMVWSSEVHLTTWNYRLSHPSNASTSISSTWLQFCTVLLLMTLTVSCPTTSTQERAITISLNLACFVPQLFFFSEPAFVIPSFGNLQTTRICPKKVCTTAHWRFDTSFSSLILFVYMPFKAFRAGIAYLSESRDALYHLW